MTDNLNGLFSPFLRSRRIKAVQKYLKGQILDYGCGIGLICDLVPQPSYIGVDIDQKVLTSARHAYPEARFYTPTGFAKLSDLKFDTIIGLAIIEHVADPLKFLKSMSKRLKTGGRIVLTTPHPSLEWLLHVGDKIGLFSRASHEEHNVLLDRKLATALAKEANLQLLLYRRFLLGANQLIIYQQ
jgi:2-polyprenyl-3-methyl-5-hydroxy-6-metoxy-1,4-benzoquinol methylase